MATRNQVFFYQGNWKLLTLFVANLAAYPEGVPLDHRYFMDVAKFLWFLLNAPHAGNYDEEQYLWDRSAIPHWDHNGTPGIIANGYAGDRKVCTWDTSHGQGTPIHSEEEGHENEIIGWSGDWVWWTNAVDWYEDNFDDDADPAFLNPPTASYNEATERWESKIHADTWIQDKDGGYAEDDEVSYLGEWRAKRAIVNTSIPPHIWTGLVWQGGAYTAGNYVLVADGIRVYKSIKDVKNSQEYPDIEAVLPEEDTDGFWEVQPAMAIEWELLSAERNFSNADWILTDSPNKFHDNDEFSFCSKLHSLIIRWGPGETRGSDVEHQSVYNRRAKFAIPKQTDPKTQYRPLIYIGSETQAFQYREKVEFDHTIITKAEYLGSVFDVENMFSFYQVEYGPPYPIHIKRVDNYGEIAAHAAYGKYETTNCPGNQYANYGVEWWNNTSDFTTEGQWTRNPKAVAGLQNYAEIVMTQDVHCYPADDDFIDRWCKSNVTPYGDGTGAANNEIRYVAGTPYGTLVRYQSSTSTWQDCTIDAVPSFSKFPLVNSEFWGENESGFELYLKKCGKYDWYLDTAHPYCPFSAMENAYGQVIDPFVPGSAPTLALLIEKWKLRPYGTKRRTWPRGLGRPSPWMCSYEMVAVIGEDAWRKDEWTPDFDFYFGDPSIHYAYACSQPGNAAPSPQWSGVAYSDDSKWHGALTATEPIVTDFDNLCEAITGLPLTANAWVAKAYKKNDYVSDSGDIYYAKNDIVNTATEPHSNLDEWAAVTNYTCTVDGDITADLKVGWMVHLAPATDSGIESCVPAHVLSCKYDAVLEKTVLLLTAPIASHNYIHWNKEVCQRHDGINASWVDSPENYTIHYYPTAELMLDLVDITQTVRYKRVYPTFEVKSADFYGQVVRSTVSNTYHMAAELADVISRVNALTNVDDTSIENDDAFNTGVVYFEDGSGYHSEQGGWLGAYIYPVFIWKYATENSAWFDGTYDVTAEYHHCCTALKIEWPEKLKELPTTVFVRGKLNYVEQARESSAYAEYETGYVLPQSTEVEGYSIDSVIEEPYSGKIQPVGYVDIPVLVDGVWNLVDAKYKNFAPIYFHKVYEEPALWDMALRGSAPLWIDFDFDTYSNSAYVLMEPDEVSAVVFMRNMIGHIDCPALGTDTEPPNPNPPLWWYEVYAYFFLVEATGEGESYVAAHFELHVIGKICLCEDVSPPVLYRIVCPDDAELTSGWTTSLTHDVKVKDIAFPTPSGIYRSTYDPGHTYSKNDYVLLFDKVYASKVDNNTGHLPSDGGTYWTAAYMATPWYDNVAYSTPTYVTSGGGTYKSLADVNLNHLPEESPTYWELVPVLPGDTVIHFTDGDYEVDEQIMVVGSDGRDWQSSLYDLWTRKGNGGIDGTFTVLAVGEDEVDKYIAITRTPGAYQPDTYEDGAYIISVDALYDSADWAAEAVKDHYFRPQSKDSAYPTPNESTMGMAVQPVEPEQYPAEIMEELAENDG